MSISIAPVGTPLESAEKFRHIGASFASIGPTLTAAFNELGKAAVRTSLTFHAHYAISMSRRERKRMQTAMARMNRRPALIHNGRKPK